MNAGEALSLSPTAPVFALAVVIGALGFTGVMARLQAPVAYKRFRALDGLRGLAALGVVLHHSAVWYFFNSTGHWQVPPSHLYTQFGQGGVVLFFVMTGFLFWGKIKLDREIDWVHLYVSRVLRLMPLFYALVLAVLLLAAISTGFRSFFVPRGAVMAMIAMFPRGMPHIFHGPNTYFYTIGVTWTLGCEVFFYLLLPVLFLAKSRTHTLRRSVWLLVMAAVCWRVAIYMDFSWLFLRCLFIGVVCYEIRHAASLAWIKPYLAGPAAGLLMLGLLTFIVHNYDSAYYGRAEMLYGAVFLIAAFDNDCFGLLTLAATRKLGEISYSVYLLQGMVLFQFFYRPHEAAMAPLVHWAVALVAVLTLLAVSMASYRWIELPFIGRTPAVAAWVSGRIARLAPRPLSRSVS